MPTLNYHTSHVHIQSLSTLLFSVTHSVPPHTAFFSLNLFVTRSVTAIIALSTRDTRRPVYYFVSVVCRPSIADCRLRNPQAFIISAAREGERDRKKEKIASHSWTVDYYWDIVYATTNIPRAFIFFKSATVMRYAGRLTTIIKVINFVSSFKLNSLSNIFLSALLSIWVT